MSKHYTLYIDAYSPETIPMARLAEYMRNLASLLGHESAVHFETLKPGSTQVVTKIDHEHIPKVEERLGKALTEEASLDAKKAAQEIDTLLSEDNASGFVYSGTDSSAKIIEFPGVKRLKPQIYGPFNQEGSLDGILISVSGADQTVHLQLQNGDIKYTGIDTNRETAIELAKHMYKPIRIFGIGRWLRNEQGDWILKKFRVDTYSVLKSDSLEEVFKEIRSVQGSDWKQMEDPLVTISTLRDKGDGIH